MIPRGVQCLFYRLAVSNIKLFGFRSGNANGITMDGISLNMPYSNDGLYLRRVTNVFVRLTHEAGFDVLWDEMLRIEIQLHPKYSGKPILMRRTMGAKRLVPPCSRKHMSI